MPVQRRRHRPLLSRVRTRALLLGVAIPLLAVGCAHTSADSETPTVVKPNPELVSLRRENSDLRTRVKNLEERLRAAEDADGWSSDQSASNEGYRRYGSDVQVDSDWVEPELDGPRKLPVVKLTPEGRSIERSPAPPANASEPVGRLRGSISLSAVPHSGAPAPTGGEYVVDARGDVQHDQHDEHDDDDRAQDYAAPSAAPASYRLVGSKLIEAAKRRPSSSSRSRKRRDRDSEVIRDYKDAMSLYRDGRYSDAEQAFKTIVGAHPQHDYADNALYWQGEAAYDQAHYADALAAFTNVVERYGGGNKAPDALLKIGLCYGRLGDADNARDVLTQLIAAYPVANASKIAKRKLADLD